MKRTHEKEGMSSEQKWRVALQRSQVHIEMALNLPVEVWKSLGRTRVNFLKEALYNIIDEEKITDIMVKDMYHQCETVVRCAAGKSEPMQWKLDSTKDPLSALSCLPS